MDVTKVLLDLIERVNHRNGGDLRHMRDVYGSLLLFKDAEWESAKLPFTREDFLTIQEIAMSNESSEHPMELSTFIRALIAYSNIEKATWAKWAST